MREILSTITMGGTITIVVFVILLCIGLSVLLCYLTIRERRRFKAGKIRMGVKLSPLEKMLKDKLVAARANTKFLITAIEIVNAASLKSDTGGKSIKEAAEAVAARAVREYRYPITAARQGKSRIIYISKNVGDRKNARTMEKIFNSLKEPFVGADGGEYKLNCYIATIKFPDCGNEYGLILRNIDLALADAARKGGISAAYKKETDNAELTEYLKIKKAIENGDITIKYKGFVNAFNKERAGYMLELDVKEELSETIGGGAALWLDKRCIDEACRLIDRLGEKSAHPIIVPIKSDVKENEAAVIEWINEVGKNADYCERLVLSVKVGELFGYSGKLTEGLQSLNAAIEIDCAENIEQYESAISALKPRYALADVKRLSADEIENAEKVMERYNVITIMTDIDNKSGYNTARQNGIELLSGSLYGDALTATEVIDSVTK